MISRALKLWIPMAFLATVLCGLAYALAQQSLRMGANDMLVQMAEDAANNPSAATAEIPSGTVDIATSLAPYVVFFDAAGHPVAGNGTLSGAMPNLPAGTFAYARTNGEDRFTWQPESGVRQAVVLVYSGNASGSYVMAGRSLREAERHEDQALWLAAAAWIAALLGLFVLILILEF